MLPVKQASISDHTEHMSETNTKKVKSSDLELKDKLVALNRVTKVTKGGRTFTFAAIVVVGNENGVVGHGLGKALLEHRLERLRTNLNISRVCIDTSQITAPAAKRTLGQLTRLPFCVTGSAMLMANAWELRDELTTYDATYVALARALGAPLVTADRKLLRLFALKISP